MSSMCKTLVNRPDTQKVHQVPWLNLKWWPRLENSVGGDSVAGLELTGD